MKANRTFQRKYDRNKGHATVPPQSSRNSISAEWRLQFYWLNVVFPDVPEFNWYLTESHTKKKKRRKKENEQNRRVK